MTILLFTGSYPIRAPATLLFSHTATSRCHCTFSPEYTTVCPSSVVKCPCPSKRTSDKPHTSPWPFPTPFLPPASYQFVTYSENSTCQCEVSSLFEAFHQSLRNLLFLFFQSLTFQPFSGRSACDADLVSLGDFLSHNNFFCVPVSMMLFEENKMVVPRTFLLAVRVPNSSCTRYVIPWEPKSHCCPRIRGLVWAYFSGGSNSPYHRVVNKPVVFDSEVWHHPSNTPSYVQVTLPLHGPWLPICRGNTHLYHS